MNSHRQQGVTLLESMIALLIFLIVSLGWLSLEANLARTSGNSRAIAQAVYIGQNKVDELRQIDPADLTASVDAERFTPEGEPDATGFYSVTWAVTNVAVSNAPDQRRVEVSVAWTLDSEFPNQIQLYFTRTL